MVFEFQPPFPIWGKLLGCLCEIDHCFLMWAAWAYRVVMAA